MVIASIHRHPPIRSPCLVWADNKHKRVNKKESEKTARFRIQAMQKIWSYGYMLNEQMCLRRVYADILSFDLLFFGSLYRQPFSVRVTVMPITPRSSHLFTSTHSNCYHMMPHGLFTLYHHDAWHSMASDRFQLSGGHGHPLLECLCMSLTVSACVCVFMHYDMQA